MIVASGLCLSVAIAPTFAQSTTQDSTQSSTQEPALVQKPAETPTTTPDPNATPEVELSAEEKELDPFLLGPWSKLTNSPTEPITDIVANNAVQKCRTAMQLSRLKFSRDVERIFPENRKELVGDIVYFRTSKGIQSLDNRTDTMLLLPKIERATKQNGDVVWRLSNNGYRVLLRFTDTSQRGGNGEFMASNDGIYLRCIKRPEVSESQ